MRFKLRPLLPLHGGNNFRIYHYALVMIVIASATRTASPSFAQRQAASAPEYTVKAAYLYNFLQYVEWPSSAFREPGSPFVLGVLGAIPPDMDRSLEFYEQTKKVRGRAIQVRRFATAEEITACHLLFLTKSVDSRLVEKVIAELADTPVLLVGETDDFIEQGVGISFTKASNRVRIRLALKQTQSQGLKPSAKLLQVAQVTD